jgi:peptidoglycan/LPS O-acetylase OafA/YrhL
LNGERGVWLFFVISGFILSLPFASHYLRGTPAPRLKQYFLRRVTRLEPPYVINIVLCAALLVIVNHIALSSIVPHLLASLTYTHTFFYADLSTINPVAWSLEVEIQFYLIMPLLALVFSIRGVGLRRAVLIATMLLTAFAQILWAHSFRSQFSIAYFIQFFLAGFVLADLQLSYEGTDKKWWWDAVSVVGWPLVFLMEGPMLRLALPFLIIGLYWAAFHGPLTNRLFRIPVVTAIGGMCYTIYLFHFLIIAFATRLVAHTQPLLLTGVSLVLIAFSSAAYFLVIERPCMDRNWPKKLGAIVWPKVDETIADMVIPAQGVGAETIAQMVVPVQGVGAETLADIAVPVQGVGAETITDIAVPVQVVGTLGGSGNPSLTGPEILGLEPITGPAALDATLAKQ